MFPKVAIIYLTYHTKESAIDIPRCLATIEAANYPKDRLEVICVENPSPHGASWPLIERDWVPKSGTSFPTITIEKNEKDLGYSGACNVGVRIAIEHGCDYVYLLNQDADVDPEFLMAAITRAEADPKIGCLQSLVLLGQEKDRVNTIGNQIHFLGFGYSGGYRWTRKRAELELEEARATNPDLEVPYFSGAAVLVRLSMVKELGSLFDTRFYMYHEDTDASFQARLRGWKVSVEPASIVYHYYAFSKSIQKFYWIERNRYVLWLSTFKWRTLLLLALPGLFVEIASFFFAIKSGWWKQRLRAWAFLLYPSTWKWIHERRRRSQPTRVRSDRAMLRWMESRIRFQEGETEKSVIHNTGVSGGIVTKVANPLLELTWNLLYALIRW